MKKVTAREQLKENTYYLIEKPPHTVGEDYPKVIKALAISNQQVETGGCVYYTDDLIKFGMYELPDPDFDVNNFFIRVTEENIKDLHQWRFGYDFPECKVGSTVALQYGGKQWNSFPYAWKGKEISFKEFQIYILNDVTNLKIIKNTETMKNVTVINSKNEVEVINGVISKTFPIVKEVFMTRNILINGTERETSIAVLALQDGAIYTGYAIRDPRFDATHNETLAKRVARNRAVNNRSNLTRHEAITPRFISKQVLKGIADQMFAEISKGTIEIKGVPKAKESK